MRVTLLVHIAAGALGLVSGAVALYVAKGGRLHRSSGMLFVYTTLTMSLTGAAIAAFTSEEASVIAGLLTAYLVITGLSTLRRARRRTFDFGAMLLGLSVGATSVAIGLERLTRGDDTTSDDPAASYFVFGTVALLASLSDVRVIRAGGLRGVPRLARHLWRMCFALFIATFSFFLGQAQVFPKPIRNPALLAAPVLAVLVLMLYWLWRIRVRRTLRGIVGIGSEEAVNDKYHAM